MGKKASKSLMQNLGAFVGHVMQGIKADTNEQQDASKNKPIDQGIKRETVHEQVRETDQGRVILRRTVIEEIVMPENEAHCEEPLKEPPNSPPA